MRNTLFICTILILSTLKIFAQTTMNIHQSNGTVLQIPLNTIDSITYTISNPGNLTTISTTTISSISSTTAISGGNITNNGGTSVTQRGICWSTNINPTTANNITSDGNGTGIFNSNLTGLTPNTIYYVRAYAINSAGTAYGNEISFTTSQIIISNPGSGVTFDGYTYPSIVLGNGQEWMTENLRTTIYANGDPITNITDNSQWISQIFNTSYVGAWCYYNNNSQYDLMYGKLYNWFAVADQRKICPSGWHVPTDAEWTNLSNYLGGDLVSGGKLKSTGTQYWLSPNTGATNQIGFKGLPGGDRNPSPGDFNSLNYIGYWWTSTQSTNQAYSTMRSMKFNETNIGTGNASKTFGYSVRCIKD
jgi:uncharacterized protein (TIGR02145 family)